MTRSEVAAADILRRKRPLALTGHPGAGKTTWLRYTFRRLLGEPNALPLVVELRRLTRVWHEVKARGGERSLEAYLQGWLGEHVGHDCGKALTSVLEAKRGPRPVLLVDGWDELGDLGEELRAKLVGFLDRHKRVLAVVTSRPYGEGRPSHSYGFDTRWVQPLADPEIAALARRFFERLYPGEQSRADEACESFGQALERSPEAQALARTPLLLTMMLIISRSSPLPDKRHQLYHRCIDSLLTALPERFEAEGGRQTVQQWRPDDGEERFRVAAALAFGAQTEGYERQSRQPIVRTSQEMAEALPPGWKQQEREGFLAWLAERAGLLSQRADGTLCFAHLSFQEYLTAWHLKATTEGREARVEAAQSRAGDTDWWETLRLWAALVEAENPEHLEPVLKALTPGEHVWLAGTMFADGLGGEAPFAAWSQALVEALRWEWPGEADQCAAAWSASRQDKRKDELGEALGQAAPRLTWLGWRRVREWAQHALRADVPPRGPAIPPRSCRLCRLPRQMSAVWPRGGSWWAPTRFGLPSTCWACCTPGPGIVGLPGCGCSSRAWPGPTSTDCVP